MDNLKFCFVFFLSPHVVKEKFGIKMFVSFFFINNRMAAGGYSEIRSKFHSLFRGDGKDDTRSKYIPNEVLAVNLLRFKLKLIDSESIEDEKENVEGRTALLNLLIEESE